MNTTAWLSTLTVILAAAGVGLNKLLGFIKENKSTIIALVQQVEQIRQQVNQHSTIVSPGMSTIAAFAGTGTPSSPPGPARNRAPLTPPQFSMPVSQAMSVKPSDPSLHEIPSTFDTTAATLNAQSGLNKP